jgi:hypothetical protein
MFRTLLITTLLASASTVGLWKSKCAADLAFRPGNASAQPAGVSNVDAAATAPKYYAVLYTYQDGENHVMKSHTFATFVKATGNAATKYSWEAYDVSWLPAKFADTLKLSFFPTAGKNFSVADTLKFAHRLGVEVRTVGPIEIDAELFAAAVRQTEKLAAGSIRYKLYDSSKGGVLGAKGNVLHCIDAIGNIAGDMHSGSVRGHASAERLVAHFQPHVKSQNVPAWVAEAVATRAGMTEHDGTLLAGGR